MMLQRNLRLIVSIILIKCMFENSIVHIYTI